MTYTIVDLIKKGYSIEFSKGCLPSTVSIRIAKDDYTVCHEALMDSIEIAKMSTEDILLETIRYMVYKHEHR